MQEDADRRAKVNRPWWKDSQIHIVWFLMAGGLGGGSFYGQVKSTEGQSEINKEIKEAVSELKGMGKYQESLTRKLDKSLENQQEFFKEVIIVKSGLSEIKREIQDCNKNIEYVKRGQ